MKSLTIELDDNALREATQQAILGILTPETRNKLLESALRNILAPSTDSFNRNKSILELAFERAVEQIAHIEARRMILEDTKLHEQISALLRKTADTLLGADLDKLAARMADAFAASMRSDR